MSTSQVTFGANLIKCQLLMSTSTVILARILQSVNFSIYRYILGNTNTGVCSDIGNTNTSIHPVSYCPIWDEAVLIPSLTGLQGLHAPCSASAPIFTQLTQHGTFRMTRRRDLSLRAKQRDHLFPGQPSGHPQHGPRSRHLVPEDHSQAACTNISPMMVK